MNEYLNKYGVEDTYQQKINMFDLKLFARVIEGDYEKRPVIERECTGDNFKELFEIGKDGYDSNKINKYEIAVFDGDNLVWHYRPDKTNFEKNNIGDSFSKDVFENVRYFREERLSTVEKTYQTIQSELWEKAFKEYGFQKINENEVVHDDMEIDFE